MTSLKEILSILRDENKTIIQILQIYYDKLEFTGFSGFEPYLSDELIKNIRFIKESIVLSEYISKENYEIEDLFTIFYNINIIYEKIQRIIQIFEENKIDITRQGSYTSSGTSLTLNFINDLSDLFEKISGIFHLYQTDVKSIDLIKSILFEINSAYYDNLSLKNIENINSLYINYVNENKGELIIDLYVQLLHQIIIKKTGTPEGKEIIKYINQTIENLKSSILNNPDIKKILKQNKLNNSIQNIIQFHNLIPQNISIPLPKLISTTLNIDIQNIPLIDSVSDYIDNICKLLSNDKKFGFIIIHKITKNPLEYNFWTLTDLNYLKTNNLLVSSTSGINNTILTRYKTILILDNNNGSDSIILCNKEFNKQENNYYYIIETLDNINYRFLIPWKLTSNIYYIPAPWFENITNKEISPSRRIELYNINFNSEIMKHLQKPYINLESLNREEIQKEDIYWKNLRSLIKRQILEDFVKLFNNKFLEDTTPNSSKFNLNNVELILMSNTLYKLALGHITNNIELDTFQNNDFPSKFPNDIINKFQLELKLCYFNDLSYIQKIFRNDIEYLYNKEYKQKLVNLFQNQNNEDKILFLRNKISENFDIMLTEVLEKLINRKSGIYLSIKKKCEVLEKTLLKNYHL